MYDDHYDYCDACDECRDLRHLAIAGDDYAAELARAEALAGRNLDYHWHQRPSLPFLTIPEWCAAWRRADRRPVLDRPIVLYRGGALHSMSWTESIGVALAFANHRYGTTAIYWEFLGDVRLPIWRCEFPPGAVLGYLSAQREYVVDVERFPPVGAAEYEPTPDDLAAYRDLYAPILPSVAEASA